MAENSVLDPQRIRKNHQSFGFIPHRFLKDGFLSILSETESKLYLFYILAADRNGISFYGDTRIGKILQISLGELNHSKQTLMDKDLICIHGQTCQVLELPVTSHYRQSPTSFAALNRRLNR